MLCEVDFLLEGPSSCLLYGVIIGRSVSITGDICLSLLPLLFYSSKLSGVDCVLLKTPGRGVD